MTKGQKAMRIFLAPLLALALLIAVGPSVHAYEIEEVAGGLEHPWSVAFLPDGGFLVTERPGRLRQVSASGEVSPPLEGVPQVFAQGQGGLFEVALAPDFAETGALFISHAYGTDGENGTALMRARLEGGGRGAAGCGRPDSYFTDMRAPYLPSRRGAQHRSGGRG